MIIKVQKVHKVLVDLLNLNFSKSIPFFWGLMISIKRVKKDQIFLMHLQNRTQKIENTYNTEGPNGPEVRESNKT